MTPAAALPPQLYKLPTCSHVRGFLARRHLQRQQAAAGAIQAATRAWLARRRAASVAALKLQMAEMAGLMREYQRRSAAAVHIQVCEGGG